MLLRSSGVPTYQLSVVVDDIDMRITHIIRGADHLSNTPKQVLIYHALGAQAPIFAHVPLYSGSGSHAALEAGMERRASVPMLTKAFCPRLFAIFWRCWVGPLATIPNFCALLN